MFKDLNEVLLSYYWFTYEYIDAEVNNKLGKTKGRLAGDEMGKETKHYMESLNHGPNWLKTRTIEIDKFLIDRDYMNFFVQIYICNREKTTDIIHPTKH